MDRLQGGRVSGHVEFDICILGGQEQMTYNLRWASIVDDSELCIVIVDGES